MKDILDLTFFDRRGGGGIIGQRVQFPSVDHHPFVEPGDNMK